MQKLKDELVATIEERDRYKREVEHGGGDLWSAEDRPQDIAKVIFSKLSKSKAEKVARAILKIVCAMTARERLPNRRACESFSFELDGLHFTATVSHFADGRVGELFLNNHKLANQSDTNAHDAAIVLSFALQFGADLDAIRKALCRDSQGRALSPIGAALDLFTENDAIKIAEKNR